MDIPKESCNLSMTADLQIDVPIEVEKVSDTKDIDIITTSSESENGTTDSMGINEISKESLKTILHFSTSNNNGNDLQTHAEVEVFNGFENNEDDDGSMVISRSPSIQANYSSSVASLSDLEAHDDSADFKHEDIALGHSVDIDGTIRKQYSPSLNCVGLNPNISQMPINDNPWVFFNDNVTATSDASVAARFEQPTQMHSVGVQVNNPQVIDYMYPNPECDSINCIMCAIIVACTITGLVAAGVIIVSTFFPYWLEP